MMHRCGVQVEEGTGATLKHKHQVICFCKPVGYSHSAGIPAPQASTMQSAETQLKGWLAAFKDFPF